MGIDNPLWIDLSLAQVLIFKNEAIATTGMQNYSVFVKSDFEIQVIKLTSLLLTTIIPINGCPEEDYILPVISSPQTIYTFLLIFECLINREPGEKMQKAQSIRENSHPMRRCCKINFLKRKV